MLEGLRKRTSGSGTARSAHNAGDASRDGRKPRQHPPPPSPQSPPPQREPSIERIVASAAGEYEVDADYLLSIAACESGLDPTAVNAAGYHGLFQFDRETWSAYGYGDIYNPVAQARTAAALLAAGHSSRWPNCS
jgi:soluble lytic murein transglycosylase-like protein